MTEHAGIDSALTVEHKSLVDALAAAQAEYPPVIKNSTNPHFNSKYADLADGMDVIRPVLGRHGIAYTQTFSVANGVLMLRTSLRWGAEELSSELPIQQPARPQDFVSLTTYYRRVVLFSICGITPMGEDDDGESINNVANAQAPPRYTSRAAPVPLSKPPVALPDAPQPRRPVAKSPAQEVDAALAPGNGAVPIVTPDPASDPWKLADTPRDQIVSTIVTFIELQPWPDVQAALRAYNDGRFGFSEEEEEAIISARKARKELVRSLTPVTAAG